MNMHDRWETGGAAQPYVLVSKTLSRKWPTPPIDEQIQIARYLDYKNYQINKYIRIKKRQIELLKELKQTIINDAVTGKIDVRTGKPYADYSKTTNSVIPEYPSHWNDSKLRQLLLRFSMKNSPSLPLLSVVREKGVIVRDVKNFVENRNYIPEDLSGYKVVREKFFVINKMKAWQGSYGVSDYEGIVSPAYYVFKLKSVSGRFFNHAIRAKAYVPFFGMASDGIRTGQWDLSFERMKDIPFYKPPIDEQLRICEYHEDWCDKIDRTIEQLKGSLEPIHELQTRLISDVVTGKLDVREIEVPDLPEDELEQEYEVEEEPVEEIENGD